jgi:hypothetical protein
MLSEFALEVFSMKHMLIFTLTICLGLLGASVMAEDENCPAQAAGKKGFDPIAEFHHAIAPAWHDYYPNKDFESLLTSASDFSEKIGPIMNLEPTFKTTERKEGFEKHRQQLADMVAKAKEAAEKGEGEAVYEILPALHDNFEYMASYLLPVPFPEFESLQEVLDIMVNTHLKNDDIDAVKTSMVALELKCNDLKKATLPPDLTSVQKKADADLEDIQAAFAELKKTCAQSNPDKIRECLLKLSTKAEEFEKNYI